MVTVFRIHFCLDLFFLALVEGMRLCVSRLAAHSEGVMGAIRNWGRWLVGLLVIFGIFLLANSVNADVFSSFLSFPGGYFARSAGSSDTPGKRPCVFYAGWMNEPRAVAYETGGTLPGPEEFSLSHRYPLSGVWIGVAKSVALRDNLDATFSAWALLPGNVHASELEGPVVEPGLPPFFVSYEWKRTSPNWYFVDGLLAYHAAGALTGLAGFRYQYFTASYRKLNPPVSNDSGDVKIDDYVPLLGVQWNSSASNSNLVFRAVGFPMVFGYFRLIELFDGIPFEAKGNFNSGYFLEAFSEYSHRYGGLDVGVFARWNLLQSKSNTNAGFVDATSDSLVLGLRRTSWTLGGRLSLAFNMPF
jgi:hypothetical protein